ncbi:small subunit ribosomal protein S2 [Geosmithia morbida]|uniref:Small subunit ribosomal protein S2 n=1 Tax=Geosmithia morbida TaxID=1094350 RepID=A0A9P5D3B8_9HYPO|nr:small subunit ribosomal protein S2 [Geosmithia morbida]KAF4126018.1 small subunit ribosomal protein S2 [Geosmithia morbida]
MIARSAIVRNGRRTLSRPVSLVQQYSTPTRRNEPVSTSTLTPPPVDGAHQFQPQQQQGPRSSRRKQFKYAQESILSLGIDSGNAHQGRSWTRAHNVGGVEMTPREQWKEFQRVQRTTKKLGSELTRRYSPTELLANPPAAEEVSLELLMASQTHMGHNKAQWNPANSRYIYGVREDTHVIALETTLAHLRRAARVVEDVAYRGGIILFVGTRNGQMEVVTSAAERAGAYHVFTKWAPGSITNRDVMLQGHATKVVDENDKTVDGFDLYNVTSQPLMPDLVVCLNPLENYTLLYECGLKTIPTIGIIDTDADPTWVTYTIPANDDSLRSVAIIGGVLGRAGQRGQERRKRDSSMGAVPWETSQELASYMASENSAALRKRKDVMGKMQQYQALNMEETQLLYSQKAADAVPTSTPVSEDALLDIMGQAAGEAEAEAKADTSTSTTAAASIEAQLDAVKSQTADVEKTMRG